MDADEAAGSESASDSGQKSRSFDRAISHKAFQFGADSGVTAEFIVKQAAFQLAGTTEALDPIFTGLQTALNPQVFSEQVRALRAQDLPE